MEMEKKILGGGTFEETTHELSSQELQDLVVEVRARAPKSTASNLAPACACGADCGAQYNAS